MEARAQAERHRYTGAKAPISLTSSSLLVRKPSTNYSSNVVCYDNRIRSPFTDLSKLIIGSNIALKEKGKNQYGFEGRVYNGEVVSVDTKSIWQCSLKRKTENKTQILSNA
ncbi:hypothetical protein CHS0354_027561 [Potamilus streckersoni]|uniref:Uncharacterized protein n=1 Tax=Potamilus streckersoni TaxID=2493646 RepID=A0AAE0S0S0_9BIVA|nr:hypothetical protein CHS0354_027561 [Potamilus streckersoni]